MNPVRDVAVPWYEFNVKIYLSFDNFRVYTYISNGMKEENIAKWKHVTTSLSLSFQGTNDSNEKQQKRLWNR